MVDLAGLAGAAVSARMRVAVGQTFGLCDGTDPEESEFLLEGWGVESNMKTTG